MLNIKKNSVTFLDFVCYMCRRARRVGVVLGHVGGWNGRVNEGCGRVRRFVYGTQQVESGWRRMGKIGVEDWRKSSIFAFAKMGRKTKHGLIT